MQSLGIVLVLIVVFLVSSVNGDNAEKARKAFLGKDNKLRDDSDLEKLRNHLLKISDKVIKENQGQQPTNVRASPKYERRRDGEPQSESKTNVEAGLVKYLYQGDIVLTSEQQTEQNSGALQRRRRRGAIPQTQFKWPTSTHGVIPYTLDSGLTAAKQAVIAQAIQFWENNACVKFQLNGAGANTIKFFNGGGCWSYIGMIGELQQISIGDGCEYLGIVTHEIAHALGFYHEQSRSDRSSQVTINLANVQSGLQGNFDVVTAMNNYILPYDLGCVMHYASEDFAVNSAVPTIVALNPMYQQTMGQRKAPSFFDVQGMNLHYGCNAACATSTTKCQYGGYPNPKNCAVCVCPSGFGGTLCNDVQSAENTVCGGSHAATTTFQSLSATVGTPSTTDAEQSCYWHITSPVNTIIQLKLTAINGVCSSGCFWNSVELKTGANFQQTGYRSCCSTDEVVNYVYTTATNLAAIIAYGNYQISFTVQYRYVAATG